MAIVKRGSRGADVQRLQILLNDKLKPCPQLKPDGSFGLKTETAVKQYQTQKGLIPDGVVGPKTWAMLGQTATALPAPPPTVTAGAPWMDIAKAEIGVHENSLPGQHNQRIIDYHATTTLHATTDETAWCFSFVNWVIKQSGRSGTNSAAAKSWLDWGQSLTTAKAGAVTVIKKKGATSDLATGSTSGFHVGFLVSSSPNSVRLLGGNQSDSVKYSDFSLTKWEVRGYRWPNS